MGFWKYSRVRVQELGNILGLGHRILGVFSGLGYGILEAL